MYNEPKNIFTTAELNEITASNTIHTDIIIRGDNIKKLEGIEKVNGLLGLSDSSMESFGDLKVVKGNLFISSNSIQSKIKSLNQLEFVGGDLILRYSNIEDLGALKKVGGKLSLRDTPIKNLGSLEFVGGDLFLPKRIENEINLDNITLKGKVKFWNDNKEREKSFPKNKVHYEKYNNPIPTWNHQYIYSYNEIYEASSEQIKFYKIYKDYFLNDKYIDLKENDNYSFILFFDLLENHNSDINELQNLLKRLAKYYPITEAYVNSEMIKLLENLGHFEKAWNLIRQDNYLSINKIIEYENNLNRELLDADLILRLGGYSHLTEFGQNNINEIKPYVNKQLEKYKNEKGTKFFDLFFQNDKLLKAKKTIQTDKGKLFYKKQENETIYKYNPEYYKEFFLSNAEYEHYKSIDKVQSNSGYIRSIPHVVEKSIFSQCRLILKQAEDLYREETGMPKVGEGWVSETELYYKISNYFNEEEVIHHASPKWLGRQHLDIYFPKLNIGIEYQGAQHYEPIEFFGGEEALEKTMERDKRKKYLCEKHNCHLIYADKGYDISEIITIIEKIISSKVD